MCIDNFFKVDNNLPTPQKPIKPMTMYFKKYV